MHPALTIDYSVEFEDPKTGETRWTFREVVLVDSDGEPQGECLLTQLKKAVPQNIRLLHRSGSL